MRPRATATGHHRVTNPRRTSTSAATKITWTVSGCPVRLLGEPLVLGFYAGYLKSEGRS